MPHSEPHYIPAMIKMMGSKLSNLRQQHGHMTTSNWCQAPPMPEDWLLRGNVHSAPNSQPISRVAKRTDYGNGGKHKKQNEHSRSTSVEAKGVFVPEGVQPSQKVKIRFPNGTTRVTTVPDQSKWMAKKSGNGASRPFFLAFMPTKSESASFVSRELHPSEELSQYRNASPSMQPKPKRPSKLKEKVRFSTPLGTVCQCSPSLGFYDSMCPCHGTDPAAQFFRTYLWFSSKNRIITPSHNQRCFAQLGTSKRIASLKKVA